MDESTPINFRDTGAYLNLIANQKIMQEEKLFRSGSIDWVTSIEEIGSPKTIINLRKGVDIESFPSNYHHFFVKDTIDTYETNKGLVIRWLNQILVLLTEADIQYPILVHCSFGKDRTGVVIAAILLLLGIPEEWIVEEYLLSEGKVNKEWIKVALSGMKKDINNFSAEKVDMLKKELLISEFDN